MISIGGLIGTGLLLGSEVSPSTNARRYCLSLMILMIRMDRARCVMADRWVLSLAIPSWVQSSTVYVYLLERWSPSCG